VRPHYDPPEPSYAYGEDYDFCEYLDYVREQIRELLTGYGPVAGVWLDGAAIPHSGDKSRFRLPKLHAMIRELQPHALISYKWGVTGTEDFLAPEKPQLDRIGKESGEGKPLEVCLTLQTRGWGYVQDARHLTADEVMAELEAAASLKANLLLNTGPLGDGSIHPEDVSTLREVGKRIRALRGA
jgi:alpha-L-fucosidase